MTSHLWNGVILDRTDSFRWHAKYYALTFLQPKLSACRFLDANASFSTAKSSNWCNSIKLYDEIWIFYNNICCNDTCNDADFWLSRNQYLLKKEGDTLGSTSLAFCAYLVNPFHQLYNNVLMDACNGSRYELESWNRTVSFSGTGPCIRWLLVDSKRLFIYFPIIDIKCIFVYTVLIAVVIPLELT